MIVAREVPNPVSPQTRFTRLATAKRRRGAGRIVEKFSDLPAARAWLAAQSDAGRAGVYLQYRPRDLS